MYHKTTQSVEKVPVTSGGLSAVGMDEGAEELAAINGSTFCTQSMY